MKRDKAPATGGPIAATNSTQRQRELLADLCKLMGERMGAYSPAEARGGDLTPRLRQTLHRLLAGDSEKQIAAKLSLSRHTIHVYVKALYRHFDVCSRGELLAVFLHSGRADTPNR